MDKNRQAFVELCDLVEPMHTKLKRARGREMSDLCSNMQGVLKMVASGEIKVNADNPELRALKTYDKDICQALNNRRICMERIKSIRTGPKMSRSIASLANTALGNREELRQQGRWKRFLKGEDMRHMEPKGEEEDPQDQGKGEVLAGELEQTPSRTVRLTENKTVNGKISQCH